MYKDRKVANKGVWRLANKISPDSMDEVMILFENDVTLVGSYHSDDSLWYDDGLDGGTEPQPFVDEYQNSVKAWRPLLEGEC